MLEPTTPVLDDFNRANGNLTGAMYAAIFNLDILSNKIVPRAATTGGDAFTAATYKGDQEVWALVSSLSTGAIYLRCAWDRNTDSGYLTHVTNTGQAFLSRYDNGVENVLNGSSLGAIASGDIYLLRIARAEIEVWCGRAGVWTIRTTGIDTTYNTGCLAVGVFNDTDQSTSVDEWGGGYAGEAPNILAQRSHPRLPLR